MKPHLVLFALAVLVILYLIFGFPTFVYDKILEKIKKISVPNPSYILIVGQDKNIQGTRRSDVIVVGALDIEKGTLNLFHIPRDLMVDGEKINSYYAKGGIELLMKKISAIVKIPINFYVVFDYNSFRILGDMLGPVEVVVKHPMEYYDAVQDLKISFLPGVYKLYGKELLAYIRYRKGGLGDLERIERQKEVIKELLNNALKRNVGNIANIYSSISKYIITNFNIYEILYIAMKVKNNFKMNFLSFPIFVDDDGYVRVDKKKLPGFVNSLKEFSLNSNEEIKIRALLVNAKKSKSRIFQPIEEARWKKLVGYPPVEFLWEDFGQFYNGSLVLVATKNSKKKEQILKMLRKLYPSRKFSVKWAAYLDGVDVYYNYIKLLSMKRKYVRYPIDCIIVLGEINR